MRSPRPPGRFPHWFVVWWWSACLAAAPLCLRLLYEETLLTWREGPQAVAYVITHEFPYVTLASLAGCVAMLLWLLFAVGFLMLWHRFPAGSHLAYLLITLGGMAVAWVPYSGWARLGGVSLG